MFQFKGYTHQRFLIWKIYFYTLWYILEIWMVTCHVQNVLGSWPFKFTFDFYHSLFLIRFLCWLFSVISLQASQRPVMNCLTSQQFDTFECLSNKFVEFISSLFYLRKFGLARIFPTKHLDSLYFLAKNKIIQNVSYSSVIYSVLNSEGI